MAVRSCRQGSSSTFKTQPPADVFRISSMDLGHKEFFSGALGLGVALLGPDLRASTYPCQSPEVQQSRYDYGGEEASP